ncbi:MAG: hypothetical protein OWT28_13085 [Firmicutes bacterium]|nr:hypothetical protein [Bacillota bacterium]
MERKNRKNPATLWLTALATLVTAGVYAGTTHLSENSILHQLQSENASQAARRTAKLQTLTKELQQAQRQVAKAKTIYQSTLTQDEQDRAIASNTNDQLAIDGLPQADVPAQPKTLPGFSSAGASAYAGALQLQSPPPSVQGVTGAS